ncbi:hypothetical protein BH23ACT3_BH23ACT3_15190 [soil metagenome]
MNAGYGPAVTPARTEPGSAAISVALVNDYEIIVHGLAAMLEPFGDRLRIVEFDAGSEPQRLAHVALFDTFAGRRHALARSEKMLVHGNIGHVVLYTWDASADFLSEAARIGVSGVLPRRRQRESEVLALLAAGLSNREIALELYLSAETVKTYVKRIFVKLGVSHRVQAAACAASYSLAPPLSRLVL